MSRPSRIPPFAALRGFEAAARLKSFRLAAEELCLSPSAVSHNVRQLEEFVGQNLFVRGPRTVGLTPAGQQYVSAVTAILDDLARATDRASKKPRRRSVTLRCSPGFASRWMSPRLTRMQHAVGDLNVTLLTTASDQPPDVEITCGYSYPPDEHHEIFMGTKRAPVCSPQYLLDHGEIHTPADLRGHILLHEHQQDEWDRWFGIAAPGQARSEKGLWFDDGYSATLAAENGAGIVLGHLALVSAELHNGTLIQLFEQTVPQTTIYTLRMRGGWEADGQLSTLRSWLLKEALPSRLAA